jgi:hypothetical protein
MKTKLLLTAALIGAVSLSAHAGVYVGVSFGAPRVVVAAHVPRVVVTAPAPVVVAAPAPVVVAAPVVETVPACPGAGYVWVPGYWSGYGPSRIWVAGCWHAPVHVVYAHRDRGHWYDRR